MCIEFNYLIIIIISHCTFSFYSINKLAIYSKYDIDYLKGTEDITACLTQSTKLTFSKSNCIVYKSKSFMDKRKDAKQIDAKINDFYL